MPDTASTTPTWHAAARANRQRAVATTGAWPPGAARATVLHAARSEPAATPLPAVIDTVIASAALACRRTDSALALRRC